MTIKTLAQRIREDVSDGWSGDASCVSAELALEAAAALEYLEKIVSRARSTLTYPVAFEIDPRGYALHSPSKDRWEFLVETLLPSPQQQEMK